MWTVAKGFVQDILKRTQEHFLGLVAGGVAFYSFLAIFPAIATCISIYGLIADANTVRENIQDLSGFLPDEVKDLLFTRMSVVASNQESSLTFGLVAGILLSLWSANRAMKAIAKGLNITFEEDEDRGFIKFNLITLALTLASSIVFIVIVSVAVVLPIIINYFLSNESAQILTSALSWLTLLLVVIFLFVMMYRYAPDRTDKPKLRFSIPGSVFATLVLVIASIAFSFYVQNFGHFDKEYGAIATVVITLLWLYLVSFVFLLGAELNELVLAKSEESGGGG